MVILDSDVHLFLDGMEEQPKQSVKSPPVPEPTLSLD